MPVIAVQVVWSVERKKPVSQALHELLTVLEQTAQLAGHRVALSGQLTHKSVVHAANVSPNGLVNEPGV